jgi:phosphate transport system substrate-binding protein
MNKMLAAVAVLAVSATAMAQYQDVTVNGAGATFPYPIYSQWANAYNKLTGIKINYQSTGSGAGIKEIKKGTVDFGATDAPLSAKELEEAGLVQFPMIVGGVVPIVNIEGVKPGQLKLTGELLADIYLGKVTKWNAEPIQKTNAGVSLPGADITVVARSDGSGTTSIYTTYLSDVSKEWKETVGAGKSVQWPVGSQAKGNEGVAGMVKQQAGSIGYVEYAYALQNKLAYTELQNKAGKFVEPAIKTFQAAAGSADWAKAAPAYDVVLVNQPGEQSWPITGASFILVYRQQKNPLTAKAMFAFFGWAFEHGKKMAEKLDYVPLPENVVKMVDKQWSTQVTADGRPVWPVEKAASK